jgi:hypothetical protein
MSDVRLAAEDATHEGSLLKSVNYVLSYIAKLIFLVIHMVESTEAW